MGEIAYEKRFNKSSNKKWIVRRSASEPQRLSERKEHDIRDYDSNENNSNNNNNNNNNNANTITINNNGTHVNSRHSPSSSLQRNSTLKKNRKFSLRISLLNFLTKNTSGSSVNEDEVETSLISPEEVELEAPISHRPIVSPGGQESKESSCLISLHKTLHHYHSSPLREPQATSEQYCQNWNNDANSINSFHTAEIEFPNSAPHRALQVPEILKTILDYVDESNNIPHELSQRRRKPMSPRHAILIYGDTNAARTAWKEAQQEKFKSPDSGALFDKGAGLFNCMLVSRQWYELAYEVLYERLHFKDMRRWKSFIDQGDYDCTRKKPSVLVLHKINEAAQTDIKLLESMGGRLRWLEFYTCPAIVPSKSLLAGQQLTRLVLPGCTKVDDRTCYSISQYCHQLEHLDLRACERVTDRGLKAIAKTCNRLKLLNVGRTSSGEMITYKGVKHIVRRTQVNTLGLAGCFIDDRTVWEIAMNRGHRLERLSLNNCHLLTDNSIPQILPYTRKLSVLELRGCIQITNMKPILQFKRYKERMNNPVLIEGCEIFELRMKEAEWLMEMEVSRQILKDCLEWIYSQDDGDVDWKEALQITAPV